MFCFHTFANATNQTQIWAIRRTIYLLLKKILMNLSAYLFASTTMIYLLLTLIYLLIHVETVKLSHRFILK